jgi:thiol-disulfide isomerase/thioredoxin
LFHEHQAERVRTARADPDSAKRWEAMFLEEGSDKKCFARFIASEPDATTKEAEATLDRVDKKFGDVPGHDDWLRKRARAELHEIRDLCDGKQAPEIVGQDIGDKPFKLSDYTGKVVIVDFWTISCASCRHMNAYDCVRSLGSGQSRSFEDGANFDRPFAGSRNMTRNRDGFVEIGGFDQKVPAELLCCFGERPVGGEAIAVTKPHAGGHRHRMQRRCPQKTTLGRKLVA